MDEDLQQLRDDMHKLLRLLNPVIQQATQAQKNQSQMVSAVRSITDALDELRQAQSERNARVLNMAARQTAEHVAWISTLESMGLKPDPRAFASARDQFKQQHPAYYMPSLWDETPDWLQALRGPRSPADKAD